MLGTLRTRNQAQNLEAAGRAYLKSFLVLNRMSVRPVFFVDFQSGPSKGLDPKNISLDRRGELAWLMVPKWHVLWWILRIQCSPLFHTFGISTHCCYCSYKLTGNEIRVSGFPFSKKSRDTILHPGKLHP
jgi:hypothetical protein